MKIYMDDLRLTPLGWDRTFTVEQTIEALRSRTVTHLSLDNDLGEGQLEGYKVMDWLEETIYNDNTFPLPEITIHSSNPARVQYMQRVLGKINKMENLNQIKEIIIDNINKAKEQGYTLVHSDWGFEENKCACALGCMLVNYKKGLHFTADDQFSENVSELVNLFSNMQIPVSENWIKSFILGYDHTLNEDYIDDDAYRLGEQVREETKPISKGEYYDKLDSSKE